MAVRLENLPGFNPHAAAAEHVYPLDSVFPSEVAHALRSEAEELLTAVGNKARVDALREWVPSSAAPAGWGAGVVVTQGSTCRAVLCDAVLCFCSRGTVWPESVLEVLEKGLNALRSASGACMRGCVLGMAASRTAAPPPPTHLSLLFQSYVHYCGHSVHVNRFVRQAL